MRTLIGFILLFVLAVVAAAAFGTNNGLAVFYWQGMRLEMSLNLFLILLATSCVTLTSLMRLTASLSSLPRRAREWRSAKRDRAAQAALRDALAQYFAGRYRRAEKSTQKALEIQNDTPELAQDHDFHALAHLLAAACTHKLQDRTQRDDHLQQLRQRTPTGLATEGAQLLEAEWAIEDRDAEKAWKLVKDLPPGVARRTQALRLKLQAAKLIQHPVEALRTAHLLAKHQAFSSLAAQSLLRSLATQTLQSARDMGQLRRIWAQLDPQDRRDPLVVAQAARQAAKLESPEDARLWLRPMWEQLDNLQEEDRAALSDALIHATQDISADWLARLEQATLKHPRDPWLNLAWAHALYHRQLWGKARRALEQACTQLSLPAQARRKAYLLLARMAENEAKTEEAMRHYENAAKLDD